jgi:hypothetical protein
MGWIDKIATTVNSALSALRPPLIPIPPILLLCEILDRPGLSAIALTSSIISRLPEAGIPTGVNPDGSENMISQYTRIMCEEVIKEFQNHAVINGAVAPGSINIVGTGTAAGIAPVAVTATNVGSSGINGIIR